ncbi:MAG TPA: GTP cyclohydrolase II [Anaerolineae bacterium]|nr:GTP cyclohydrolase II [Anaerolineae bacterium]
MASTYQMTRMACSKIPTQWGEFRLYLYRNNQDNKEHLALVIGQVENQAQILTRLHSECFTGDVLGSLRCDCGEQLSRALQLIGEARQGVVVYLRQEGRGIGLLNKLRAYNLQDEGYDTVDANLMLGHDADERDYTPAALILRDLEVRSVRLLTNNPAKVEALRALHLPVAERIPLLPTVQRFNQNYLDTKARRMRHWLDAALAGGNGHQVRGNGNGHGYTSTTTA